MKVHHQIASVHVADMSADALNSLLLLESLKRSKDLK